MTRHEKLVRLGDLVVACGQIAATVVFVLVAVAACCVFGVITFLFLLDLAGKALS